MMSPGVFVDALRHLDESRQILRTKVQTSSGSSEVETLLFGETAGNVLAAVAAMFALRLSRTKANRAGSMLCGPQEGMPLFCRELPEARFRLVQTECESRNRPLGRRSDRDHRLDWTERRGRDQVGLHRNHQKAGQHIGNRRSLPRRRKHMVSLVEDDPMRTAGPHASL